MVKTIIGGVLLTTCLTSFTGFKFKFPENLSVWDSSSIIEKTLKDFNHNVNFTEEIVCGLYTLEFFKEIDNGRPLLWGL